MTLKPGFLSNRQNVIFDLTILSALSLNLILQIWELWQNRGHSLRDVFLILIESLALYSFLRLSSRPTTPHHHRQLAAPTPRPDDTSTDLATRLAKMQQLTRFGDWTLDIATGKATWSEELFHIFGRDPSQPPPQLEEFFQLIPETERDHLRHLVEQSITQGTPFSLDHQIMRSDGTIRYVACRGEPLPDQAGQVIRLVGTTQDITAQKQLELELQASEARLNDILNTEIAAIFTFRVYRDRTYAYDYISAGVEAIYGYTASEFLATPSLWMTLLHRGDRELVVQPLFERFFAEQQTQVEFRINTKGGESRWVSSTTVSRWDAARECWVVTAIDINITERKRVEADRQQAAHAVRQQRALLRQVIDSIPHHLFVKDEQGQFLLANQAAAAIHGVTPEQLVGHREVDFNPHIDESWQAQVRATNRQVMESRQAAKLPDSQLIGHTGETHWCQVHLTPYVDLDGKALGVIGNTLDVTDRKELELALQASEAQLSMTLNAAKASIISYQLHRDRQWEYLYVSPGCEAILGYRAEELLTDPSLWASRVMPEDWETVFSPVVDEILQNATSQLSLEYRFRHRDDTIRWIATELTAYHDVETDTWVITLVDIDISDRKQAEIALRESQQLLQQVLDSVPQAIFWKDRHSIYLGCNQNFANYAGLEQPIEIVGKTDDDLPWQPEETAYYQQIDHDVITTGVAQLHIIEPQHLANGNKIWIETSKVPLEDTTGQVVGVLGTYEDITYRKATEEALHYSEAKFRAVFEQATIGIAMIDQAGHFLSVNEAYANITGYSRAELTTMHCNMVTHPDDQQLSQQSKARLIAGLQTSLSVEKRYLCKDGTQKWVNLNLGAVMIRNGEPLNFLTAMVVDITDRKQTERALIQQTAQEQLFNRVVQTIRSSLDLDTIFATAVQEVANLLTIHRVSIVQYLSDRQSWLNVMEHWHAGIPHTAEFASSDIEGPIAERLKRLEIVRLDTAEAWSTCANGAIAEQFWGAWLLVPLIVNDQLWGSFSLLKEPPMSEFSQDQVDFVLRLADQVAIAIQQSTIYSQLQTANQQLQYIATHDALTQLANRRYFNDQLTREWSRLIRSPQDTWLSLVLCDIDYFKQYNDFYGHPQGDICLAQVAQALSRCIQRPTDIVARYGGEEFAFILPETDVAGAVHIVQQVQAAIWRLDLPHGGSSVAPRITLSFGIACLCRGPAEPPSNPQYQTPEALIQMADQALYEAKSEGRDRYEVKTASFP